MRPYPAGVPFSGGAGQDLGSVCIVFTVCHEVSVVCLVHAPCDRSDEGDRAWDANWLRPHDLHDLGSATGAQPGCPVVEVLRRVRPISRGILSPLVGRPRSRPQYSCSDRAQDRLRRSDSLRRRSRSCRAGRTQPSGCCTRTEPFAGSRDDRDGDDGPPLRARGPSEGGLCESRA